MNRNQSVKWLKENTWINVEDQILDYKNSIRGVYAIYDTTKIKDTEGFSNCIYIGKAENIYRRLLTGKGHIPSTRNMSDFVPARLINDIKKLNGTVTIKVLEKVPLQLDHYSKDMQRLANVESNYITQCQLEDGCLNQLPEGSLLNKEFWK